MTTGFVVLGVGAYTCGAAVPPTRARVMMSTALWLLTVLVPLQMFLGDQHGLNTLEYQPAKLAAIEALWDTGADVPLTLFALSRREPRAQRLAIEMPELGSLILTHSLDGDRARPQGLSRRPAAAGRDRLLRLPHHGRPRRADAGAGGGRLVAALSRRAVRQAAGILRVCQVAIPIGFLAVLAGWTTTEVGRQPWTVYGLMRTADSVTPSLTGHDVLVSLLVYVRRLSRHLSRPASSTCCGWCAKARAPAAPAAVEAGRPQRRSGDCPRRKPRRC